MKIALVRYNLKYPLTYEAHTESTGGAEEMVTFLKVASNRGYEIHLHSEAKDPQSLDDEELKEKNPWLKSIKYRPRSLIDEDVDFLLIMNGPDNFTFRRSKALDGMPNLLWISFLVKHYKGVVFYNQYDYDLPYVFNPMQMKAFLPYGHVITPLSQLENKKWIILTKNTRNDDTFFSKYNTDRYIYSLVNAQLKHFSSSIWGLDRTVIQEINPNPQMSLIYAGGLKRKSKGSKYRVQNTIEMYGNSEDLDCNIFGPEWDRETLQQFGPNTTYYGRITQEELKHEFNNSYAHLTNGSELYEHFGCLMPKYFDAIACGCASFINRKLQPAFTPLPILGWSYVDGRKDFHNKVRLLKDNKEFRINFLKTQREALEKVDYDLPLIQLETYLQQAKDLPYHTPTEELLVNNVTTELSKSRIVQTSLNNTQGKKHPPFKHKACYVCQKEIHANKPSSTREACKSCGGECEYKHDDSPVLSSYYDTVTFVDILENYETGNFDLTNIKPSMEETSTVKPTKINKPKKEKPTKKHNPKQPPVKRVTVKRETVKREKNIFTSGKSGQIGRCGIHLKDSDELITIKLTHLEPQEEYKITKNDFYNVIMNSCRIDETKKDWSNNRYNLGVSKVLLKNLREMK